MKTISFTKKGPGRLSKTGKAKKLDKSNGTKKWIEGGNPCDDAFIARFPDFAYEGSTALTIWRMSWEISREVAEDETPRIQLI